MRNEPCTCGCAHCPTVVWDAEVDLATISPAPDWFLDWVRANGIDPHVCAAGVFRVVQVAPGQHMIQWQEVITGEGFYSGTEIPRGVAHQWGALQMLKRRRETPMITAHLPGAEVSA